MSFLNIKDKRLREQTIEDYLALQKRLKSRYMDENEEDRSYRRDLEEQYEPVVSGQERMTQDITDQLMPIQDKIQQLAALVVPKTEDAEIQTEQPDEVKEEQEEEVIKRGPFDLNEFGPEVQAFFLTYMDEESRKRNLDTNFGIRFENRVWKIGNKKVTINSDDSMVIDGEIYEGTPGFWSLVVQKVPKNYTDEDLNRYKELLHETHVLHQDFDPYVRYPRANKSKKWKKILGPIWKEFTEQGIVQNEADDSINAGYETAPEDFKEGQGVKMYLQKNGRCFALNKTTDGGIKLLPRPKLAAVPGDGLYLRRGSGIYHGEGLLLGKSSPFRNIPVLGWLL